VIADDAYVRAHFAPGEIVDVAEAHSVVRAPRSFRSLLLIKTRSRLGVIELSQKFPRLWASKRLEGEPLSRKLSRLPLNLWPLVPVYLLAALRIRRRARAMTPDLATYHWERDESTR
jgi:hypothetical protein